MMEESDELSAFRKRWKEELDKKPEGCTRVSSTVNKEFHAQPSNITPDSKKNYFGASETDNLTHEERKTHRISIGGDEENEPCRSEQEDVLVEVISRPGRDYEKDQPQYVCIAEGLLDGRTSPLMDRIQQEKARRKRRYDTATDIHMTSVRQPQRKLNRGLKLVDQFIQDLNDINDIPFFDVELPYELALKIFRLLDRIDLGRCAQVSKSWRVLAEDDVLWYRLCLGEGYHTGASVSDSPCWKSTLRDCWKTEKTVQSNWKNRVGSISHLQYELGKILCDADSSEGFVIAGYTSGDVRLWDILHWDIVASYLRPTHVVRAETPTPHVSHVAVNEKIAAAAYENGYVDIWSIETGLEPIHHYQHLQRVHSLSLCRDSPAVASASGMDVRVDCTDDRGYWRTLCLTQLPKPVDFLRLVPGRRESPLVTASANESVYLLAPEQEARVLHSVYGHPVTCLDVTASKAALGVKRHGWAMNDGGNKIQVYSLESSQSEITVGSAAGDFTCVDLRDSIPHLLVCGNKDRRVRVFDLRSGSSVVSLYAHHMGVTSVQADDWKIVSGGVEGLVCVWEMRMGAKLWEMHNRHPVRHVRFSTNALVTANIPDEKCPRGACITDDDLTAHRRHRGVICYYDFSADSASQDHVLPICRSNYAETTGYNYNIGLAVPYDELRDSQASL
ncbi:F-box/WD repeat-containing protein 8 [Chanos chanos]|uniref:F-box/WD repeat-containing protein 8 n=1 Tax=Chanos chanos TaxID=29144 RepID=A0A6J2WTR6_CHACN|nr:F-box/WD repeat-containing protein 8 [Chanos chanos]